MRELLRNARGGSRFAPAAATPGGVREAAGLPALAAGGDRQKWNADFSDHALLYVEVQML